MMLPPVLDLSHLLELRQRRRLCWLGVMSGTSGDGIDVARVELEELGEASVRVVSVTGSTYPFVFTGEVAADHRASDVDSSALSQSTGERLVEALAAPLTVEEGARWHARLGHAFAHACECACRQWGNADAIALSGHTFAHLPTESPATTLQLGDAAIVARRCQLPVIFDFRASDVARGGEGAPLVPAADRIMFGSATAEILLLNLGGISNLTLLPANDAPLARDCGPCNLILNEIVRRRSGAAESFDRGGARAMRGNVQRQLLSEWLEHPFLAATSQVRSTGREEFGELWVAAHATQIDALSLEDALATAVAWIAHSVQRAWKRLARPRLPDRILVGGGGVHNAALLRALGELFTMPVEALSSEQHAVSADLREAAAFAILGQQWLQGRNASFPQTTGCKTAGVLGALRLP